jgi:hypothetical protein
MIDKTPDRLETTLDELFHDIINTSGKHILYFSEEDSKISGVSQETMASSLDLSGGPEQIGPIIHERTLKGTP